MNKESAFLDAVDRVLKSEGGYVDDPKDRGGETKFGISKRAYPDLDIAGLTIQDAVGIYKRDYWDRLHLDEITDPEIAAEVFDSGVNMGRKAAIVILQQSLNLFGEELVVDGHIGPNTLKAANKWCQKDSVSLGKALNLYQGTYYLEIIKRDPSQARFARGWLKRVKF